MADKDELSPAFDLAAFNLDDLSVQDLVTLGQAVEAKRAEKMEAAKRDLVAEFREKASGMGLSLDDLMPQQQPAAERTREKAAVKYRGPNGEEWSGRGRQPRWLAEAEAAGRTREDFKV